MKTNKKVLMNKISDQDLTTLVRECNAWGGSFEHLDYLIEEYTNDTK